MRTSPHKPSDPGSQLTPGKPPTHGGQESAQQARALILVATVLMAGVIGFVQIEGWSIWKSLYFTLVTVTTVGYGDEGLSDGGKVFATLLLVGGVGTASYAFATIIQTSLALQLDWRKRMRKKTRKLREHTIVCGFGRMGFSVCEKLAARNSPFVVVERDPQRIELAVQMGYTVVEGTTSGSGSLVEAGLAHASHVVAAVNSFAENVVIALECKEARPDVTIIARAERDEEVRKLERLGVSRVLCPFNSGGREVVDCITRPGVADFLAKTEVQGGGVALAEIRVEPGSELHGLKLGEYGKRHGQGISFVALQREGEEPRIPPTGQTVLTSGDHLIVAGDPEQIEAMTLRARSQEAAAGTPTTG